MIRPAREKVNIWHPAETTQPGKTSLLNAHSVSALKLRDRSSAETLDVPGAMRRREPISPINSPGPNGASDVVRRQRFTLHTIDITYCGRVV